MISRAHYQELVQNPGKFEGERPHTPYYYNQWTNGDGESHTYYFEECDCGVCEPEIRAEFTEFVVDYEESVAFGIPIGSYVVVWEDDQGFAYSSLHIERAAMIEHIEDWLGL